MSKGFIEDTTLTAIGNAIREKRNLPSEEIKEIYETTIVRGIVTKYSMTSNNIVDENGVFTRQGDYVSNSDITDVVTIPGATNIHVKITYSSESTAYDWTCVFEGNHPEQKATNYEQSLSGKLGGTTVLTKEYDIVGDSVTFCFKSDSSSSSYIGYQAVVTGEGDVENKTLIGTEIIPINRYKPSEMVTAISAIATGDISDYGYLVLRTPSSYTYFDVNLYDYVDNLDDIVLIYFQHSSSTAYRGLWTQQLEKSLEPLVGVGVLHKDNYLTDIDNKYCDRAWVTIVVPGTQYENQPLKRIVEPQPNEGSLGTGSFGFLPDENRLYVLSGINIVSGQIKWDIPIRETSGSGVSSAYKMALIVYRKKKESV